MTSSRLRFLSLLIASAVYLHAAISAQFTIDLTKNVRTISPLIYGSNSEELTQADGITFRRSGGNRLTGYNWENNASNAGTDWFNTSDSFLGGGNVPGKAITDFHDKSLASGAMSIITLPAAGYVAKDKKGVVDSEATAPSSRWAKLVYEKGSAFSLTPDTTDDEVYTDEFVHFMVKKYGGATNEKGIHFYLVDNEPALWSLTHPRIHPKPVTCVELIERTVATAKATKKIDPAAQVFGGVFYGYYAYATLQDAPDWKTVSAGKGYTWFIDYFLAELKKASDQAGSRLVDVLDVHWYSEANGDHRINDVAAVTVKDKIARMQAPRSLWDSSYVETSWISLSATPKGNAAGPINLLPHLFSSIQSQYPGTKLSITEHNYGGGEDVTGGIAEADYLGILGRDGVFASNYWPLTGKFRYVAAAFRLFRNYDGKNSRFADAATYAMTSDRENTSVYASFVPGGNEIHLIALNKNLTESVNGSFAITSPVGLSTGTVFGFDGSGAALTEKSAIASFSGNTFSYLLPPLSASHFVIKTTSVLPMTAVHAPKLAPEKRLNGNQHLHGRQQKLREYQLDGRTFSINSKLKTARKSIRLQKP